MRAADYSLFLQDDWKLSQKLTLNLGATSWTFRLTRRGERSNLNAAFPDQNTGQIINPGDFGRIISTSNNPRLIQFALKLNF